MKKTILTLLVASMAVGASAQEKQAEKEFKKDPIAQGKFWDNWFIQGGAGASVYLGGQNAGQFGNRIRPVFDLGVGKWVTSSLGVRMQYNYSPIMRQYSKSYTSPFAVDCSLQKFDFMNLHGDVMLNLNSAFGGYNENRVYEVIPYLGAGWARVSYDNAPTDNELAVNFGIINKFRVSRAVDINLELRSTLVNGRLDHSTINNQIDMPVAATLGFSVRLGKNKSFKRVSMPVVDYSSYNSRIQELENSKANADARAMRLAEELEAAKKRGQVTVAGESKVAASPVALFFGLGKATLDKKELTNLEFYVKNAIKADKNKTFTLIGSADKATGSKAVNQRLSEQRMQYVYNLLVDKYNIAPNRLIKKAEGDTNNRFAEPELNRAVIVE